MNGSFHDYKDLLRGMIVKVNCKVKKMYYMAKIQFWDIEEVFLKIKKTV